jgi:His/Glu/Gln/Arg/opine family amino acid ABC transporter permease subunit
MTFDAQVWGEYLGALLDSLWATIWLFLGSMAIGTVGGALLALMRTTPVWPVRAVSIAFTWVFRGLPPLVILFFTYFGLPALGVALTPMAAGILGLGLTAAAYTAEIFRSGLSAVERGQREAAQAQAMTPTHNMWRGIAPQAFRDSIPPYFSNAITALKATSLASTITVAEITGTANRLISTTFQPLEILTIVAIIYLLLNTVLVLLQFLFERAFALKS